MSTNPLKWSLNKIAEETGFARQTIKNKMVSGNIEPDSEGCYTTRQMLAAIAGDYHAEKTRMTAAQADLAEMERDERAHLLIASELVAKVWTEALGNLRATVMAADLPKVTRAQLIKQLKDIPICDYTETTAPASDEDSADGA